MISIINGADSGCWMFGQLDLLMISCDAQLKLCWKIDLSIEYVDLPTVDHLHPFIQPLLNSFIKWPVMSGCLGSETASFFFGWKNICPWLTYFSSITVKQIIYLLLFDERKDCWYVDFKIMTYVVDCSIVVLKSFCPPTTANWS